MKRAMVAPSVPLHMIPKSGSPSAASTVKVGGSLASRTKRGDRPACVVGHGHHPGGDARTRLTAFLALASLTRGALNALISATRRATAEKYRGGASWIVAVGAARPCGWNRVPKISAPF